MKRKFNSSSVEFLNSGIRVRLDCGERLSAIRLARQWLLDTGLGDSAERARNMVKDVENNERWIKYAKV